MPDEGRAFLVNASALLGLLTGPLACLSPLPVVEGEEGRSWVAVSGPDLRSPVPRLGASVGAVGLLTQQMLSLRLPGVCSASGSPRGGEGSAAAALRAPLPARVRERPSVVPLERSRSSLRCLRPSGGVVSLNPGVLLGSPPRWCVCVSREWLSSGGGVEAVGEACLCSSSWRLTDEALQGTGRGLCAGRGRAGALVLVPRLPVPQTPPAQLGTGGSWSASAGPKERDDPGEGRRALGEKAFSSDPRGSLGVPDPPAAAPPECAVAAVAAARARGQNTPPTSPLGLVRGRVRRPRGWGRVPLVAYRGPRLPPSSWERVPLGPACLDHILLLDHTS